MAAVGKRKSQVASLESACDAGAMWWKLILLGLVTTLLVLAVQPIRTHAVKIEIPRDGTLPPQQPQSVLHILSNMYVTPTSLLISAAILVVGAYLAFRIIRS
jgi:hypothetical protein